MADVNINKFRASVVRDGSKPASPGFIVSEGQDPVDPAGNGQNHLPVTIATAATGLSITDSQVLGGAGTVGQYIRGDGSLADFPQASGGGSSVSYYLNGSISQGTIGGVAYKELNKVPILGAGTDFTINADGYIASFLTDAGDPNLLEIPGGNWNFETYFSASSSGGSPSFYVELYKYDGTTFTLIASSSSSPELIAFGTNLNPYFSTLAVPTTTLALTDRLAVRYYVNHSGRTITLHTENNHLCQVVTTFTTGLTSLNGLTAQVQNLAVGTSGTDFNIASATATHTFNLPTASAVNRGALSSADWTTFNNKQNALTNPVTGTGASGQVAYFTGTSAISSESNLFWDATNDRLGIGTNVPTSMLTVKANTTTIQQLRLEQDNATDGWGFLANRNTGTLNINRYGVNPTTNAFNILMTSGNVGIGTDTPNEKLQVSGAISATGTATTAFASSSTMDFFSGATRFISRGGNNSTRGSYTFKIEAADGSLSINPFVIDNGGAATFISSVSATAAYITNAAFTEDATYFNIDTFGGKKLRLNNAGNQLIMGTNGIVSIGSIGNNGSGAVLQVTGYSNFTSAPSLGGYQVQALSNSGGSTSYGGVVVQSVNGKAGYLTCGDNSTTTWYGAQASFVTLGATLGAGIKLRVNADDNTGITIPTSGNVGIGTATSPAAELQVGKASDVGIAMSNSSSVTSGARGSLSWYNSSVSTVALIRAAAVTDNVGTELQFHTRPAAGSLTQVFTLASTGAATFSSSVTAATLTTIGTAVAGQNVQLNLNGVSGKAQRIEFQNSGVQQWLIGAGAASETTAFEIFNSTGVISLSINKSTNAATFSSSVTATNGNFSGLTRITGVTGVPSTGQGLELYHNSSTGLSSVGSYDRSGGVQKALELQALTISLKAGGSERLFITSSGNVVIQNNKIYGSGEYLGAIWNSNGGNTTWTIGDTPANQTSWNLRVNTSAAKSGGGSWGDSSDGRLKKDIKTIENALDKINKLNPVTFEWINPSEHNNQYNIGGFIAQEIKEIFPQFVNQINAEGKDKDIVGINEKVYGLTLPFKFDAYIVKSIQELYEQIQELKQEIDTLKN